MRPCTATGVGVFFRALVISGRAAGMIPGLLAARRPLIWFALSALREQASDVEQFSVSFCYKEAWFMCE